MPPVRLFREIEIRLTPDEVWRCLGAGRGARASLGPVVEAAAELATRLAEPAAVSTSLGYVSGGRGAVEFEGGTRVAGRMLPHLMEDAEGAVFLIATAGGRIEARVRELFAEDDDLSAFILDAAGSAAAMAVLAAVAAVTVVDLEDEGYRIGPCVKPGTDAWPIEGQRQIFALLPAAEIGVALLDSLLMRPQKTQSGMIPFGRALRIVDEPGVSPCARCSAGRCPMRIEPFAGPPSPN